MKARKKLKIKLVFNPYNKTNTIKISTILNQLGIQDSNSLDPIVQNLIDYCENLRISEDICLIISLIIFKEDITIVINQGYLYSFNLKKLLGFNKDEDYVKKIDLFKLSLFKTKKFVSLDNFFFLFSTSVRKNYSELISYKDRKAMMDRKINFRHRLTKKK